MTVLIKKFYKTIILTYTNDKQWKKCKYSTFTSHGKEKTLQTLTCCESNGHEEVLEF